VASSTKSDLLKAFLELLNERPFDKISVTDVASRCGVSRNTFYYHFQDIFDLVDELFMAETKRAASAVTPSTSVADRVKNAMNFARSNRRAVMHLYNSASRPRLERYLYDIYRGIMLEYVKGQAAGLAVTQRDIEDLSIFYASAFEGVVVQWIRDGMQDESDRIVNILRLIDGNVRASLERASRL
jgi:AcrR family transcriptional regulator